MNNTIDHSKQYLYDGKYHPHPKTYHDDSIGIGTISAKTVGKYTGSIKRIIRVAFEGQAGDRAKYYSNSYWKNLLNTYGDAQNFHGYSGTSLPSYIIATAGNNYGVTNDSEPIYQIQ